MKILKLDESWTSLIGKEFKVENSILICKKLLILESGKILISNGYCHFERDRCDFIVATITK